MHSSIHPEFPSATTRQRTEGAAFHLLSPHRSLPTLLLTQQGPGRGQEVPSRYSQDVGDDANAPGREHTEEMGVSSARGTAPQPQSPKGAGGPRARSAAGPSAPGTLSLQGLHSPQQGPRSAQRVSGLDTEAPLTTPACSGSNWPGSGRCGQSPKAPQTWGPRRGCCGRG